MCGADISSLMSKIITLYIFSYFTDDKFCHRSIVYHCLLCMFPQFPTGAGGDGPLGGMAGMEPHHMNGSLGTGTSCL